MKKSLIFLLVLVITLSAVDAQFFRKVASSDQLGVALDEAMPPPYYCCERFGMNIENETEKWNILEQSFSEPICCDYVDDKASCLECYTTYANNRNTNRYDTVVTVSVMKLTLIFFVPIALIFLGLFFLTDFIVKKIRNKGFAPKGKNLLLMLGIILLVLFLMIYFVFRNLYYY